MPAPAIKAPEGTSVVKCRVTFKGDGKIADGSYGPTSEHFGHYAKGDTFEAEKPAALALQERGFAEIV